MCLRLDSSGYWRSDAVQLTSIAGGSARCVLSNVNNQQVVVVTYTMPEGEGPEGAAPGSPPPGSSPTPDAEEGDDELVTVTVPQSEWARAVASECAPAVGCGLPVSGWWMRSRDCRLPAGSATNMHVLLLPSCLQSSSPPASPPTLLETSRWGFSSSTLPRCRLVACMLTPW